MGMAITKTTKRTFKSAFQIENSLISEMAIKEITNMYIPQIISPIYKTASPIKAKSMVLKLIEELPKSILFKSTSKMEIREGIPA